MQRHCNSVFVLTVVAQQDSNKVIAHPGKNVVLLCDVIPSGKETAAWIINDVVHTVQHLHNGILTGYSSNGSNLIIENIMMNDYRNDTEHSCGTVSSKVHKPAAADVEDESDITVLYIAGEYQYTP